MESLIDFNSPLKGSADMLDPLVPLPKMKNKGSCREDVLTGEGDNPFDSVILQICKADDPFEIVEHQALKINGHIGKNPNESLEGSANRSIEIEISAMSTQIAPETDSRGSYQLDNRFSQLGVSAHLEKQIFDESSGFLDSECTDVSLPERSINKQIPAIAVSPIRLPSSQKDVRAFVTKRIEKCIEKTLNESRRSMSHRRSASITALYSGSMVPSTDNHTSLYRSQSRPYLSENSFTRHLSTSTHELPFPRSGSTWRNQLYNFNSSFGMSDRFTPGFRRSMSVHNMYSSFNACEPVLNSSFATTVGHGRFNSNRPSSSLGFAEGEVGEDDSVVVNGRTSCCVFMEAKNIASLFRRKADSQDCPGTADSSGEEDFLTRDDWNVELVQSDTESESSSEPLGDSNRVCSVNTTNDEYKGVRGVEGSVVSVVEKPFPLCRESLKGQTVSSVVRQTKHVVPPVLVPPPLLPSSPGSATTLLKPKTQGAGVRVVAKGPMKAVVPVGNMMRKKDTPVAPILGKQSPRETSQAGSVTKRRSVSAPRQSVSEGVAAGQPESPRTRSNLSLLQKKTSGNAQKKSLQNNQLNKASNPKKPGLVAESTPSKTRSQVKNSKMMTPVTAVCGRPIACSTPAIDDALSLQSPPVCLQLSRGSVPKQPFNSGHERSKSASVTGARSQSPSGTPLRKMGRVRVGTSSPKTDIAKLSCKNISAEKSLKLPTPVYTSTPLKANNSNNSRLRKPMSPGMLRQSLKRSSSLEKENIQPARLLH